MFCYDSPEYVKDMGTRDRFHQVEADYKNGTVQAKNLSNKQKAVVRDRDGTINKYVGFLRNIDDFELIDGVSEAIKKINQSGYLAIVVTNQPVIAIPPHTSRIMKAPLLMEDLLLDCDLDRYPEETASISYNEEKKSPFVAL